jgi:hypothetical protein
MKRSRRWLVLAGCAIVVASGCAAKPRGRPLHTTPIAEGADTLESARNFLAGRWVLASLRVTTEDGRGAGIDAAGALTADTHGTLAIEYRMSEAGQTTLASLGIDAPNPVVSTSGRVVIDSQQRRITDLGDDFQQRAQGFDPDLAARRANPFALERTRHYALDPDGTLVLSTRYDSGKDAIVSRWKRAN